MIKQVYKFKLLQKNGTLKDYENLSIKEACDIINNHLEKCFYFNDKINYDKIYNIMNNKLKKNKFENYVKDLEKIKI